MWIHKLSTLNYVIPFLLVSTSAVLAEDHQEADEPSEIVNELFLSDTASSQEAGEWQITVIPQFQKKDADETLLFSIEVEYGISDHLQVEFEYTPYIRVDEYDGGSESGTGNYELGLQYSWRNWTSYHLDVAMAWSHEFAEGERSVINDSGDEPEDEDNLYIVIAKMLGANGNTKAFAQIGSEFEGSEIEAYVNFGLYSRLGAYVLSGEFNWEEDQSFITPGLTWLPQEGWEFGTGIAIGVDGEDDYQIIGNIVYEWE